MLAYDSNVSVSPARTSALAESFRLPCGAVLPNRIAKASLSEQLADRRNGPTEELVRLYERWAEGGAGLLITGNVMIDRAALEEPRNVVVEDDRDGLMLTRWARAATARGAQCWVQVSHPGRQSLRTLSPVPVAPSAVAMKFGRGLYAKPRALEEREIVDIIARFAKSSAVLKAAGFSGIQLQGAHGYLISSFLSPLTNRRTDDWGGTPEKRLRFLLEVYRATRAAVGPDFPIGIKLNSADFQRGGFEQEESLEVVRRLEREGIDLIDVSGGSYENAAMMGIDTEKRASTAAREAYFLAFCERVRRVSRAPLLLTGGFRSLPGMESAVRTRAVDVVGLGRPLCVDPDFARRLLAGDARPLAIAPKRVGLHELDTLLEVFWYTHQLRRIARGLEPDLARGRWRTLAVVAWDSVIDSLRLQRR